MARTVKMDFSDLPTIYNLDFAVGPTNAPNNFVDVLLVQTLMKMANFTRFTPALGPVESSANIKVDGIFGPQTSRLIKAFEADRKSAGLLLVADGVLEPSSKDGFTGKGVLFKIIHLNRAAKNRSPFGNDYNALPFVSTTHPLLRSALQKGAVRPPAFAIPS
jgi:peptidoglycan hydrolase-like protein with peptidoglycan-binding domain